MRLYYVFAVSVHCLINSCHGQWTGSQRNSYPDSRHSDFSNGQRGTLYRSDVRFDGGSVYSGASDELRKYSDSRCEIRSTAQLPMYKTTKTLTGVFQGRIIYLCDLPEFTRSDQRPVSQGGADHKNDRLQYPASVVAYLGIPYALPPLGQHRYKAPQAHPPLGNWPALSFKPGCTQSIDYTGASHGIPNIAEDCLYLNIYTPNTDTYKPMYAVMVYIHGGNFDHGASNLFPGHMLAASQEVIVVTFNYRLGPLGFFATGDDASPGNYGLMDQEAAIQWVYDHIEAFGGDNTRITLFGTGAGAASAGIHMTNQMAKRKLTFKRVIAQGGAAVAEWAVKEDAILVRNISRLFGEQVGCFSHSSWQLMQCLQYKANNSQEFRLVNVKPPVGWLPWGPVLDRYTREHLGQSLSVMPEEFLEKMAQDVAHIYKDDFAYMTGVTRDEASYLIKEDKDLKGNRYIMTPEMFDTRVREYAKMYNYTLNEEAIVNALSFMYTPWEDQANSSLLLKGYVDMLSDSYFAAPHDKILKLMLKNKFKVYAYVMNYSLESYPQSRYKVPDWEAVPHGIEDLMVSGAPFMDPAFYADNLALNNIVWSEGDRNMSQLFMQAWANFAKTGDPTSPRPLFGSIRWEPATEKNLQYLSINATYYEAYNASSFMFRDYRQKQAQFWNDYLPSMIMRAPPTWPPTEEPLLQENRILSASLWTVTGAACLFLLLAIIGFCCYCRASSEHLVDDDQIPHASTQSLTEGPSGLRRVEYRNRYATDDPKELKSLKNTSV
ncbi:acetylcholinesterase-like [Ornithodoros turicata]|uniref:acetylcholinesterase-like n=1 Tax=Ornithodoros turicata TaxID=34597 RepID=UPI00313A21E5